MTELGDESFEDAAPAAKRREPATPQMLGRTPPYSIEAEEHLLSCCLLDGMETIERCIASKLPGSAFYSPANRLIFERLCEIQARTGAVDAAVLAEELKASRQLDGIGGFAYLAQISSRVPTTAQAQYFIDRVMELHVLREAIRRGTEIVERAYNYQEDILEFIDESRRSLDAVGRPPSAISKPLNQFQIPEANDRSVLLGNRFLNRGDSGVLVSTSGVGKSSMSLQMAVTWALGLDAFGIKSNGPLKSLIIQSEDSEGDVAEVWESLRVAMELTPAQVAVVERSVIIVTDRINRGAAFIAHARQLVRKIKPALLWINPLQAFIDGDVTEARDLGAFLREGLNSLNEPPEFGTIIVHHTVKPPAPSANAQDRKWSETMYDMAGGAEIINWARFIMSLRATDKEGHFNLVLAKRGRRAGVTKKVEQGAGFRDEPVTTIALKHASRIMELPNGRRLPMIFWEGSEHEVKPVRRANGNPYAPTLEEILPAFRVPQEKALTREIARRAVSSIRHLSQTQFDALVAEGVATGRLTKLGDGQAPRYFTGS